MPDSAARPAETTTSPASAARDVISEPVALIQTTDSGVRQFVMSNVIRSIIEAKTQAVESSERAESSEIDESSEASLEMVDPPKNGSVSYDGDGGFIYVPKTGFEGTDNFTYMLVDAQGNTTTGTITIDTKDGAVNHTKAIAKEGDKKADKDDERTESTETPVEEQKNSETPAEEQENIEEQPKQERAAGKEVSSNTQPIAPDGIFTEKGELFSTFHDQIYREANMFEMEVDELLEIFLNAA